MLKNSTFKILWDLKFKPYLYNVYTRDFFWYFWAIIAIKKNSKYNFDDAGKNGHSNLLGF